MLRRRIALALLIIAGLTPVTSAQASDYQDVLRVYQQRGTIPGCKFSTAVLSGALKGVSLYGAQYFADFTAAIQTALSARASGACLATPVSPAGAGTAGSPGAGRANLRLPPGNVTAPTQAGLPAPILLLAAATAVVALLAGLIGLARRREWEPVLLPWWRHLWQETGYRAGGVWAEFVDWLRSA